jgi:hypothetical protein
VLFLSELGDRFPAGMRLVADFLVPSGNGDIFAFQFGRDDKNGCAELTTRFPNETLVLFSKIIDETNPFPPYGLATVLTKIAEAAPELRHDEGWQRLHRLTIGRSVA